MLLLLAAPRPLLECQYRRHDRRRNVFFQIGLTGLRFDRDCNFITWCIPNSPEFAL